MEKYYWYRAFRVNKKVVEGNIIMTKTEKKLNIEERHYTKVYGIKKVLNNWKLRVNRTAGRRTERD